MFIKNNVTLNSQFNAYTMRFKLFTIFTVSAMQLAAQTVLTNFDDVNNVTVSTDKTNSSLFTMMPTVVDNPDVQGINPSAKCLGATNIANADWYGNFVCLKLNTPVTITASNRYLSMLLWRGVQAKDCRIAINGYEVANELYCEKVANTGQWERVVMDMGASHLNETLSEIYIIYSCNWDTPRSGWGAASYYIDDVVISSVGNIPNANIAIDASKQYQTIHHFGSSDAWTMDFVGRYFNTTEKEKAARRLFSRNFDANGNPEGIGLSGWRFNVGAGSAAQGDNSNIAEVTRRTECFMNADGTWDWTRQQGQRYFLEKAKRYGVEHFIFFSNSAPVFMTRTGLANAKNTYRCNLDASKMPAFADFLTGVAEHFIKLGFNVSLISPLNEPQFDWSDGQEGSPWDNSDIKKMAQELNRSIKEHGLNTQMLLPEASQYDRMYGGSFLQRASNQLTQLFQSGSSNYIGNLETLAPYAAGHSYWTYKTNKELKNARMKVRDVAQDVGIGLMQTEFSFLEIPEEAGFPSSPSYMDYALYMAKVIHGDLVYANMSAWNYWTSMAQEQYGHQNRFYLMRLHANDSDSNYGSLTYGGTVEENKDMWALGNYSLFIRPGYKRLNLTGGDEMNYVLASAWLAPDSSKLVVVYVNTTQVRRFSGVKLLNLDREVVDMKKYVTSSTSNLALSTTETTMDRIVLPARSVSTVVMTLRQPSHAIPGDVNADGLVDVDDINIVINIVLGQDSAAHYDGRADVNNDGLVDVDDINIIINAILGQ